MADNMTLLSFKFAVSVAHAKLLQKMFDHSGHWPDCEKNASAFMDEYAVKAIHDAFENSRRGDGHTLTFDTSLDEGMMDVRVFVDESIVLDIVRPQVLMEEAGGVWENHSKHPPEDWQYEVSNGDTRLGYWEWVASKIKDEEDLPMADTIKVKKVLASHRNKETGSRFTVLELADSSLAFTLKTLDVGFTATVGDLSKGVELIDEGRPIQISGFDNILPLLGEGRLGNSENFFNLEKEVMLTLLPALKEKGMATQVDAALHDLVILATA